MRSMTGYGTSEFSNEKVRVSVDLKAYNNKYLDISLNMPSWLNPIEGKIRDCVKDMGIFRGRVDLNIRVKELQEDVSVIIDEGMVNEVVSGLKNVISLADINPTINISDILQVEGILKSVKKRDIDSLWLIIENELKNVLSQFLVDKEREGLSLKNDIFSSLELILSDVIKAESYIPAVEDKIKLNFQEKFRDVLGHEIDENRILNELGVLLVKYDINEEVVRLKSHIDNFKTSSDEIPCGKKLDFICQEMNREINTIGSKSPLIEISQLVVNMKNSLEQIREQARNVE